MIYLNKNGIKFNKPPLSYFVYIIATRIIKAGFPFTLYSKLIACAASYKCRRQCLDRRIHKMSSHKWNARIHLWYKIAINMSISNTFLADVTETQYIATFLWTYGFELLKNTQTYERDFLLPCQRVQMLFWWGTLLVVVFIVTAMQERLLLYLSALWYQYGLFSIYGEQIEHDFIDYSCAVLHIVTLPFSEIQFNG